MGEKRRRISSFSYTSDKVEKYVRVHHQSIKTLLAAYNNKTEPRVPELIFLTNYELWQCSDGIVVLAVPSPESSGKVNIYGPISKSMSELLSKGKATDYFDEHGNKAPQEVRFGIRIGTYEESIKSVIIFTALPIFRGTRIYRPRYIRAMMAGWEAELSDPTDEAVKDFRYAFATDNIVNGVSKKKPELKSKTLRDKANIVLSEYKTLLDSTESEEELQVYLKNNPILLYPDLIKVFPKLKLGAEYVTDFVTLIESGNGPEYVFIEIERPNKRIFTQKGYFHSDFTQAKDQLLDWDKWITQNVSYLQQKLPGILKPTYHLIYGRDKELDRKAREKLQIEFSGTTRRFSTYDGLAQRFEKIIIQLTEQFG